MKTMTYKGYPGRFEYDANADIYHGEVLHLNDVVTFQGRSIKELKTALADSVEDYLVLCREVGKEPEKPFSGKSDKWLALEIRQKKPGRQACEKETPPTGGVFQSALRLRYVCAVSIYLASGPVSALC